MRSKAALSLLLLMPFAAPSCTEKPQTIQFYEMTCCATIDAARYDEAYALIAAGKKKTGDFFRGIHTGTTTGRGVVFSAHYDEPIPPGGIQIRITDRVSGKIVTAGRYGVGPGQTSLQSYYNFERPGRYTVEFLAGNSIIGRGQITVLEPERDGPYR